MEKAIFLGVVFGVVIIAAVRLLFKRDSTQHTNTQNTTTNPTTQTAAHTQPATQNNAGNMAATPAKSGRSWGKIVTAIIMTTLAIAVIIFWQEITDFDFSMFSVERTFSEEDSSETLYLVKLASALWYLVTSYWAITLLLAVVGIVALKKPELAGFVLVVGLVLNFLSGYEGAGSELNGYRTVVLTTAHCESNDAVTVRIPAWKTLDWSSDRESEIEVYFMDQHDQAWVIQHEYTHQSAQWACFRGTDDGISLEYILANN